MKILKHFLIVLFISFLLFLIIINIFKPIFTATNLIFPYSISKFDIVLNYPVLWKYIKITYCITCFFNIILVVNSILKFISIKFTKKSITKFETYSNSECSNYNLLLGTSLLDGNAIYISEKGLYQNILITGTIGSRKNSLVYVSVFKSIT